MNKPTIVALLFLLPLVAVSQKKTFSFNQVFAGQYPAVFNDLPEIQEWTDDEHYVEVRTDDKGNETAFLVEAISGKSSVYQHPDTSSQRATPDIEGAQNATVSPDGKYVAFTRKGNLYIQPVTGEKETAVTSDGGEGILNGYASWIYYEEILGRASHYKAFWWSPDSRHIAFMRFDETMVPIFPIYFADGQHGYLEKERYPKAGDQNPEVKIGIVDVSSQKVTWADFDEHKDQYFGTPYWSPANDLFVQWMNRGQDTLNVYKVNNSNGARQMIYQETQPTWITLDDDRFTFLSGKKGFILTSDKDGWMNLYLHDDNGKQVSQITRGNFWDTEVLYVDEKNKAVYIRARKEHSGRFDIYKASFGGNKMVRLSSGNYSYDLVRMSPKGKYIITAYSNVSTPPVMVLMDNKGRVLKTIADSKGREFDEYALPATKYVTAKSSDGKFDLPMTITYPINFDSTKKYPVWISIYGGPNAGTVFDRWKPLGGLTQWWAQEGIIQVTMDNRSSGHFGKNGMNYIYKQLGKWEIEDYMACANWLKSLSYVDRSKVGITGGSYGGYVTCMALTYGANVFTHGIANYSVTDWQLYDTHYTERFMNTPADNPNGYKETSVLTYVDRYKGGLRIVHGSTDDNVHMQNTTQLIDALQDRNKHFELMIYPNQRHGIGNTKARHNFVETCRFIYNNMLNKELPRAFGQ